jgi:hypothetical protein
MRVVLTGLTGRGRRTKSQHKLPEARSAHDTEKEDRSKGMSYYEPCGK